MSAARIHNTSGLRPLGSAVLVERYNTEKKVGAIILPETSEAIDQRATVIEVGPEAWKDEKAPRAVPGDRVLVSRLAGYMAMGPADDKPYRMINARDIFAQIVGE